MRQRRWHQVFPPRPTNLSFKKTLKIAAIKGAIKTTPKFAHPNKGPAKNKRQDLWH